MRVMLSSLCLALISLIVHDATACSCAEPPPPKDALAGAVAVFSGKVTQVKEGEEFAPKQVTFEIEKSWKGTEGKSVVVTTAANGALCGVTFEQGKSYLVYCYGEKDQLKTNLCTRTKTLDAAGDDLKDLGEGQKP